MPAKRDISALPIEEQQKILARRAAHAAREKARKQDPAKAAAARAANKAWRERNPDYIKQKNRAYSSDPANKQRASERGRAWRQSNPDQVKEINAQYRAIAKSDPVKYAHNRFLTSTWIANNRGRVNETARQKRLNDPVYKLGLNMRGRLKRLIKGHRIERNFEALLGCTRHELIEHIEGQFLSGMSWDNHGPRGWHLDHIIPLSWFDLTDPDQFQRAVQYTNLQPLWWQDNLAKGNRLEPPRLRF